MVVADIFVAVAVAQLAALLVVHLVEEMLHITVQILPYNTKYGPGTQTQRLTQKSGGTTEVTKCKGKEQLRRESRGSCRLKEDDEEVAGEP